MFLIQIDASSFAEFEISEFEISRFDCISYILYAAFLNIKNHVGMNGIISISRTGSNLTIAGNFVNVIMFSTVFTMIYQFPV